MWRDVEGASEILAITNGVHVPTWQDRASARRAARPTACGRRTSLKREMLAAVAERTGAQLDPDVLTLGCARRAAGYKRADLIFSDRRASSRCSRAASSSCSRARRIRTTGRASGWSPPWSRWRAAPRAVAFVPTTTWPSGGA